MKKLLICIEELQNEKPKMIESRLLIESEAVKWKVIDNPPVIEDRPGEVGKYDINEQGEIVVRYEQREKTELEKLREKLDSIDKKADAAMEAIAEVYEGK